jgi:hypothetical protein
MKFVNAFPAAEEGWSFLFGNKADDTITVDNLNGNLLLRVDGFASKVAAAEDFARSRTIHEMTRTNTKVISVMRVYVSGSLP